MIRYKISDLENLSGIRSQTLRMWEQRYNVLIPHRTKTNIRYYDENHLKKLLNMVSLLNNGDKISVVSGLSEEDLNLQVSKLANSNIEIAVKEDIFINQLIGSGLSYDESMFERSFNSAITHFGLMESYRRIFYPMLLRIGLLWTTSELNPSQEHFVSNLVKQKLFAAIDALGAVKSDQKWLLFLPSNEMHDLGLLVANYGLKSSGKEVVYLGADVPLGNLNQVLETVKPTHCLMFSVKSNQHTTVNKYLKELGDDFPNLTTYICCSQSFSESINFFGNQLPLTNFDDFLIKILEA